MRLLFPFCALFSIVLLPVDAAEIEPTPAETHLPHHAPLLPWTDDLSQTLVLAKAESKPIYLYFSGSTWCIWCKKMDSELHNSDEFRQKMVGNFLFVRIDLPAGGQPSDELKHLLEKYNVSNVPTVLLLSPDGKEITRLRYQKTSPETYADLLLNIAKNGGKPAQDLGESASSK